MKIVKVGENFGKFKILSSDRNDGYTKYTCQCLKCKNIFRSSNSFVHQNKDNGCPECLMREKEKREIERLKKEYIGKEIHELTVIDILGLRTYGASAKRTMFVRCRCRCQKIIDIPLTKLIIGQVKTCGHDRRNNLNNGLKICKSLHVDGTFLPAIDGGRKTNKNSETGHNGVSFHKKAQKYRAYINFKHKQYYLGMYDDIEQAIAARECAEKEVYGNFLEWYASKYPENWNRITNRGQKNQ